MESLLCVTKFQSFVKFRKHPNKAWLKRTHYLFRLAAQRNKATQEYGDRSLAEEGGSGPGRATQVQIETEDGGTGADIGGSSERFLVVDISTMAEARSISYRGWNFRGYWWHCRCGRKEVGSCESKVVAEERRTSLKRRKERMSLNFKFFFLILW